MKEGNGKESKKQDIDFFKRIEDLIQNPEKVKYLSSDLFGPSTRHEMWLLVTALTNLELLKEIKKLNELLVEGKMKKKGKE